MVVLLVVSVTAGVTIGPVPIGSATVWRIIGDHFGLPVSADWTRAEHSITWDIRLPRVLLAALVGAGLSVVGVAVQALVRNSLADPFVLGISSGAAVGATAVIVLGIAAFGAYTLSIAAFVGAFCSILIVFAVAQRVGRLSPLRLVLSGTAVAYVLSALTSFLVYRAQDTDAAHSVLFWLLGSFGGARWSYLPAPLLALAAGATYLFGRSRALDALAIGDATATTLGIDVHRARVETFLVVSLITGVVVAVSGAIGFVGLMMPHAVRLMVGPNHHRVLPIAALAGASFMVWVDIAARTVVAPEELPVGVLTALIGGPFFVFLMRSKRFGLGDR
jgi:iron complex transport system permease protein